MMSEDSPEPAASRFAAAFERTQAAFATAKRDSSAREVALLAAECAIELAALSADPSLLDPLAKLEVMAGEAPWAEYVASRSAALRHGLSLGQCPVPRIGPIDELQSYDHSGEMSCDIQRLLSTQPAQPSPPSVSWTTSWLRHPAFDRVTPMGRSFESDREFGHHVLQLAHELTHVFSLRGAVGFAVTIMRIVLLRVEMMLWRSSFPEVGEDLERAFMKMGGIATPAPGVIGHLPAMEVACAIGLKSKLLQEVWKPLFEGLAVFAESCVDPAEDPAVIDDVNQCIRNLFDVDQNSDCWESAREEHAGFVAEFDALMSKVLTGRGEGRLESYLNAPDKVYFAGYLAIRSVVARLRQTADRPLSGEQVFRLLLHAFKYGTVDFIPDMDQAPDAFFEDALERVQGFLKCLSRLSKSDIDLFLAHHDPKTSPEFFYWENGSLIPSRSDPDTEDRIARKSTAWIQRLFVRALMPRLVKDYGPPSTWDVAKNGHYLRQVLVSANRCQAHALLNHPDFEKGFLEHFAAFESDSALLPVGQGLARFWLATTRDGRGLLTLRVTNGQPNLASKLAPRSRIDIHVGSDEIAAIKQHHDLTGSPHLNIARAVICDDRYFGLDKSLYLHVLYLWYGDWSYVRGCSQVAQTLLEEGDPDGAEALHAALRRRFCPNQRQRIERDTIAEGKQRMLSALRWLDESPSWHHGKLEPDISAWLQDIRGDAQRALDPEELAHAAIRSRAATLQGVFGDVKGIADLVEDGYDAAIRSKPGYRSEFVKAVYKTGRKPLADLEPELSRNFLLGCAPLFVKSDLGWDIRPTL